MDRELSYYEAAEIMDVFYKSLVSWENNTKYPRISFFANIIKFLGYDPLYDNSGTLLARMETFRRKKGWNYRKLAKEIGIQEKTLRSFAFQRQKTTVPIVEKIENYLKEASD